MVGAVAVSLRLLGEVSADVDGRPVDLGPPRQRCVLAALAVDADRVVPVDRLIERVWGATAERRARATLHSYISRLRRTLAHTDRVAIVRRSGGYALMADAAETVVDLYRFRELCTSVSCAPESTARAVRSLTDALALWRGPALTGVDGEWVESERDRLGQERLAAQHDLAEARLRAGQGGELVAELAARTARHPLDERAAGQYLLALHQSGRTADALEHYHRIRTRLVEELGTEPGTALQLAHRQVLAAGTAPVAAPASGYFRPAVVPRQLPGAPAPFVGRHDELTRLDALNTSDAVTVSAITGMGGIGKTWLALHWAHRNLHRYPDGQLFIDLRGFSPEDAPLPAAAAVRGFVVSLGVPPASVPTEFDALIGLYRSLVADKRMLIVLDNVHDTGQVLPLLPGTGGCTVLVTSRDRLTGLAAASSARMFRLGVLDDDDARSLLAHRLGPQRVAAEPEAMAELLGRCVGLPLALGIVASRAAAQPSSPLQGWARDLRDTATRLGALDAGDPQSSVRATIAWSHAALTPAQADLFALLSSAPGPDIDAAAVTCALGPASDRTWALLRALTRVSLLDEHVPGRFRMHDLVRLYGLEHRGADHDAALGRLVSHYVHIAHAGERLLAPQRRPVELGHPPPGCAPRPPADEAAMLSWFDAEHANLLALQRLAVERHHHTEVWQLAWALDNFHWRRGHLHYNITTWLAGVAAAEHLGQPELLVRSHRRLGRAYAQARRHTEAVRHLSRAHDLAEGSGDVHERAHTENALAWAWSLHGDDRKALKHALHALDLYRGLANPVWLARALNSVGWYQARLGRPHQALEPCAQALDLFRRNQDVGGEAATLDTLGLIAHHSGDHANALKHHRAALTLFRRLGNHYLEADTLANIAYAHAAQGELRHARDISQQALQLYRRQGRPDDAARVQRQLDTVVRADGDQPGTVPSSAVPVRHAGPRSGGMCAVSDFPGPVKRTV
ncbi:BTAD domain-containing putative transcriptional regulator [Amycolatopsis sp. DG1A-15b]|uniref:AfsR/SARP family transcriptional regulator n=1 Tax=Amycolatopsis sp. DG1A-15b TaxID=3052846 RepID=UPI003342B0D7